MAGLRGHQGLLLAALLVAGCVRDYRAPRPGEPSAQLTVRLGTSTEDLLRPLPAAATRWELRLEARAEEEGGPRLVAMRRWTEASELERGAPLEPLVALVRADQPLALEVRLALVWQTRRTELRFRGQSPGGQVYAPPAGPSFSAGPVPAEVVEDDARRCASVVQLSPRAGAAYELALRSLAGGQACALELRPGPGRLPDGDSPPY